MGHKLHRKRSVVHSNGDGYITRDGHTMFQQDIVRDLNAFEFNNKRLVLERNELQAENVKLRKERNSFDRKLKNSEKENRRLQGENERLKDLLIKHDEDFDSMQTGLMDRIAELNAFCLKLKESQRWRSVEEELPEDDTWVLTLHRIDDENDLPEVGYRDDDQWMNDLDPTHWQPLQKFGEKPAGGTPALPRGEG